MKHLKNYTLFESVEDPISVIKKLNHNTKAKYSLDQNGLVNVDGDIEISDLKLEKISVNFGIVNGNFRCTNNSISSLLSSPYKVIGTFNCSYNNLANLEHSPIEVDRHFYCNNNHLTSLKGVSKIINGDLVFNYNQIKKLDFMPEYIGCEIRCIGNSLDRNVEELISKYSTGVIKDYFELLTLLHIYTSEDLASLNNKTGLFD